MRRSDKRCDNVADRDLFLKTADVMTMGLNSEDSVPYVLPLNFVYDGGQLYFHSAKEGRKAEILHSGGDVGFNVYEIVRYNRDFDNPCASGVRYKSVIGVASVALVSERSHVERVLNLIMEKYAPDVQSHHAHGDGGMAFKDKVLAKLDIWMLTIKEMEYKVDERG